MTERPDLQGRLASRAREACLECPGSRARKATEASLDWMEPKVTEDLLERRARTARLDPWGLLVPLDPRDLEENEGEMARQE